MTHTSTMYPPTSPELLESVLDLSRPELSEVMERYTATVVRRPIALVVERPDLDPKPLKEALTREGWDVHTCPGPSGTACPLMSDGGCDLRESADVAVVFLDRKATVSPGAAVPRLRCAAHEASPGVVALEGSLSAPQFADRVATIGALREPGVIVGAIRTLLSRNPRRA